MRQSIFLFFTRFVSTLVIPIANGEHLRIDSVFGKLKYDLTTGIVTIVLLPLMYLIFRKLVSFLKRLFTYIMNWLVWSASRSLFHSLATRISLRRYCSEQLIHARTRYLLVPGAVDVALETDSVYVSMTLEPSIGQAASEGDLTEIANRLRIIGDPGSGKSSIVKRLYRDACNAATKKPTKGRLPILIDLKTIQPEPEDISSDALLVKWAVSQLRLEMASSATFDMNECFEACMSGNGLLVLLDGLDEVSSGSYPDVCRAINLLSRWLERNSPESVIILTMRTQFHMQVHRDFDEAFPPGYFVRRFTPNDIYQFLLRWPFPPADRQASSAAIYGTLSDRPSLREMCTSPLVLAMYVVAHEQISRDVSALPETRTDFYDQVLDELLIARRGRQVGSTVARRALRDQRETILGRLAWENLSDKDATPNLLSWPSALNVVREHLSLSSNQSADEYFMELSKETGLFTIGKSGETFQFIHLTFCEFLAAKEVADGISDGWNELMKVQTAFASSPLTTTRLSEIIPFAAALLPRQARDAAIQSIADQCGGPTLARSFLETQMYGHPTWREFASLEFETLVGTQPEDWNEECTNRLHLYMVTLANAERWAAVTRAPLALPVRTTEVYENLVGESQDKLARVFTSFAAVDGAAALRLAESLGFDLVQHEPGLMVIACKEPPMLTTAVSRYASSHGQHRLQWSAIIVDAALLYQNVAASLNWQFEPIDLPALARSRWNNQRVLGLYSECLQVAIEAALEKRIDISQFPRLSILFEVRPVRRSRSWLGTGFSLMTLVLLGISVISLLTNTSHAIFTGTAAFIGVLLTFGAVFVAFYPIYREYIYCKLLNLPFLALESSGRSAREIGDELNRVSLLRVAKPIFNRRLKRQILASEELVASRQRTLSKNG